MFSRNYQLYADFQAITIMVRDRMPELRAYQNNSTTFGKGFLQDVHIQIYQNKKLKEVLDKVCMYMYMNI